MANLNLERPLEPVPLTLELIRETFKPDSEHAYVIPSNEFISNESFERIDGEGYGDCGPIGTQNCINMHKGLQTQYTYDYQSVLKPLKQQACDIMMQYVLDCSEEDLKEIKRKTAFVRGIVRRITFIAPYFFYFIQCCF